MHALTITANDICGECELTSGLDVTDSLRLKRPLLEAAAISQHTDDNNPASAIVTDYTYIS
jgi:hypothetical protein